MDPVIAGGGFTCLAFAAAAFTAVLRRVMRGDAGGLDVVGLLLPGWAAVFGVAFLVLSVVTARV